MSSSVIGIRRWRDFHSCPRLNTLERERERERGVKSAHAFFLLFFWLQCTDPHHKDLLVFCTLLELQSWAIACYHRRTVVGIGSAWRVEWVLCEWRVE
jgi:hypothetical protein